jgi:putative pre-16S rRNA nuclease
VVRSPPLPPLGRLLAVDWGERRFGLALSDETQCIAFPLTTLTRRTGKRFPFPAFRALLAEHHPVGLVLGLPLTPEGTEADAAFAARALGSELARRSALPLELVDERLTTARAHGVIREQGGSVRGRRGDVDALAAAVLLQHFLESRRHATR